MTTTIREQKAWTPVWFALACTFVLVSPVLAQSSNSSSRGQEEFDPSNPVSVLLNAGRVLPNDDPTVRGTAEEPAPTPGDRNGNFSATMSILLLLTILSIAPALLVMTTSFTRIVVVLSLLRQAIGTQSLPPSQVIVGLSLFLTFLVMAPTFDKIHRTAIVPLQHNQIDQMQAWENAKLPLRQFMFEQINHGDNWNDLNMILEYRGIQPGEDGLFRESQVDMLSLIPAFMISELKIAFLIGFRLYLPFLIIDMVIASVLISMGMMMLPPVLISLPFKLLLFVLVDGWHLVTGNLLNSFAVEGVNLIPGLTG